VIVATVSRIADGYLVEVSEPPRYNATMKSFVGKSWSQRPAEGSILVQVWRERDGRADGELVASIAADVVQHG